MADKVWISPVNNCDLCDVPFGEDEPMYDANVGGHGQWGNVCGPCFNRNMCELGTGKGQKYELKRHGAGKAWVKVTG